MTTATDQPSEVLHEQRHGYLIFRSYLARSGTGRICSTPQGWVVRHPLWSTRGREFGLMHTLADARARIDAAYKRAHDRDALQWTDWSESEIERLGVIFPDAPNPKIMVERAKAAERRAAAQAEQDAAERVKAAEKAKARAALNDAAPDMLAALRTCEAVLAVSYPEESEALIEIRAAIAKATTVTP